MHCAVRMTNLWGSGKNASYGHWCGLFVQVTHSLAVTLTWQGPRAGLSHSSHWCGARCCWTWFQSSLNREFLVNDWLLVFWYYDCNFNTQREKGEEVGVRFLWAPTAQAYVESFWKQDVGNSLEEGKFSSKLTAVRTLSHSFLKYTRVYCREQSKLTLDFSIYLSR